MLEIDSKPVRECRRPGAHICKLRTHTDRRTTRKYNAAALVMCVQRESMADGSGSEVSSSAVTNLLRDTSQRNTARWYEGVH